jgi:peptide/nickel transport system permease protein
LTAPHIERYAPVQEARIMARFFLKHLLFLCLTLAVVSLLVFLLTEFTPGDVARKYLGAYATQEQVDLLSKQMGLDRPVLVRYGEFVGKILSGDLGTSTRFRVPVKDILFDRLENTGLLALVSFLFIVPLSMLFGIVAGMREGSFLDRAILMTSALLASVPEFAMGVFLATIFVVTLNWLPGTATLQSGGHWPIALQLVLPVAVIVLFDMGYVVSMVRASMVEIMRQPYIRTAVLKGMRFRQVVVGHALRNAMINPVTVILLQINYLVSGVVVVESVFAYPGFGRMMLEASLYKDIALIEAGALVSVFVAVATQIVGDLAYMLLDPRIRS